MGSRSVDRALWLLRLIADQQRPVRFAELQERSAIPKGSLHGLLASLEDARFLSRTSDGYVVGIAAFEVGTAMPTASSLRQAAAPHLDRLAEMTREACHFGLFVDGDVVYVDRRDAGEHGLRFTVRIGQRLPAYGTGLGKAMLALLPADHVSALYPARLAPVTDRTIRSRKALLETLQVIRATGHAVEVEESTPGVCCIGMATVVDGEVIGMSVSVPVSRATRDELTAYAPALRAALDRAADWLQRGRSVSDLAGITT